VPSGQEMNVLGIRLWSAGTVGEVVSSGGQVCGDDVDGTLMQALTANLTPKPR